MISPLRRFRITPSSPAGAERAPHRTADLRADADRAALFVVAQQDAFDVLAIGQLKQQFFGAVVGRLMTGDLGGENVELLGQFFTQRPRQIGHLLELAGPLLKHPLARLCRPIAGQAAVGKPGLKLRRRKLEKMSRV